MTLENTRLTDDSDKPVCNDEWNNFNACVRKKKKKHNVKQRVSDSHREA